MEKLRTIWKAVGETPLMALERFRRASGIGEGVALAYAGRLDPMAEGKLLVLIGEECKEQKKYHGLDKEYEFEILLDAQSDTGDVLGLVDISERVCGGDGEKNSAFNNKTVRDVLRSFLGNLSLPYPVFSSKTVSGKPLFLWQLEGRIHEIDIPIQYSYLYKIELIEIRQITARELEKYILTKIESIPKVVEESKRLGADFRRAEIRTRWQESFEKAGARDFTVLRIRATCSSGTYIRSLAPAIAKALGTTGLALSIRRTQIGTFQKVLKNMGLWRKRF